MQPVILDQGPGTDTTTGSSGPDPGTYRRPGRPRSEQAEQAIIEATLGLFAEQGFEGVCVEAVAARAGVGKATIYRRWPNKEELLLAALGSMKSPFPEPKGGSVRDDLVAMLTVMCEDKADPRRDAMRAVIRRGIGAGELRADVNVEIAMHTLTGIVLAKEKSADGGLDGDFAAGVVDELLLGLAAR